MTSFLEPLQMFYSTLHLWKLRLKNYGLSVNYKQKYSAQQQVIKDNYAIFEVPYNGTDNNDYVDGQGLLLALSAALGNLQTSLHFTR